MSSQNSLIILETDFKGASSPPAATEDTLLEDKDLNKIESLVIRAHQPGARFAPQEKYGMIAGWQNTCKTVDSRLAFLSAFKILTASGICLPPADLSAEDSRSRILSTGKQALLGLSYSTEQKFLGLITLLQWAGSNDSGIRHDLILALDAVFDSASPKECPGRAAAWTFIPIEWEETSNSEHKAFQPERPESEDDPLLKSAKNCVFAYFGNNPEKFISLAKQHGTETAAEIITAMSEDNFLTTTRKQQIIASLNKPQDNRYPSDAAGSSIILLPP
ncbi:MAG: hypothetical protein KDI13_06860 [Alphaproteobacteria bacterium]|nr:hypothetical protein [Alphaproteobacteria bacterium]